MNNIIIIIIIDAKSDFKATISAVVGLRIWSCTVFMLNESSCTWELAMLVAASNQVQKC